MKPLKCDHKYTAGFCRFCGTPEPNTACDHKYTARFCRFCGNPDPDPRSE